jgi:hypothetical protein
MAKKWSVVPRALGERERLIADALAQLKKLKHYEVLNVYHADSKANFNLEMELLDLDIEPPRPPVTFFYGERTREDIEQNTAEWKVYGLDIKWLIEQHHETNKKAS